MHFVSWQLKVDFHVLLLITFSGCNKMHLSFLDSPPPKWMFTMLIVMYKAMG